MPRPRLIPVAASFAVVLTAYWAYALVVVGLIEPEADTRVARTNAAAFDAPGADQQGLGEHFPPGSWPLADPKVLESRQAKVLFGQYTKHGEYEVELHPCAILFTPDEPGLSLRERNRRAVVLEADEGAVLEFDQPLDLNQAKIGRLVRGRLTGPVVIRSKGKLPGPEDDLRITTRDVSLSEKQIATPHPVAFQWGPNRGRGQDLTIELAPDAKAPQHGPNVGGVKSVLVRRVERLQLQFPKKDVAAGTPAAGPSGPRGKKAAETVQAEVTCQGPFRFDLDGKVASFADHVDVWEIHPSGPSDHLSCELLSIYFDAKTKAKPDAAGAKARPAKDEGPLALEPQRIEATGNPVVVHAPSRNVQAFGQRLEYNLQSGRTILDGGEEVVLKQGPNEIHARDVQYQPAGAGKLGQVLAHGPGWIAGHQNDKPDEQIQARWKQQLQIRPHQQNQVISLTGGAEIVYRGIGRLAAEEIHFWLIEDPRPAAAQGSARLQPDRMMARENVRLNHPQVDAAVDQLEVWFECIEPPPGANPPAAGPVAAAAALAPAAQVAGWLPRIFAPSAWDLRTTASGASRLVRLAMDRSGPEQGPVPPAGRADELHLPPSGPEGASHALDTSRVAGETTDAASVPQPAPPKQRFDVTGRLLRAQVAVQGRKADLSELMIEDHVRLVEKQTEKPGDRPMIVTGERVHVVDASRPYAAVAVTGPTAHFEARGLALNGSNINLNRGTNRLWIDGPGWMTLPLDRDPQGRPAADAGPLEIHWQERMNFDGLTARFDDSVVATSKSYHLRTETLEVTLAQRVRFADAQRDAQPQVQRLVCRGGAWMENRSQDEQGPLSLDRVQVGDLAVDVVTGAITAAGPGWFRTVRRGNSQGLDGRLGGLGRQAGAQAPDPGKPLVYVGVDFQRSLTGNLQRREMTFAGRVRTVYGPVAQWDATLDPDKPELAGPRGAVMGCDQLQVAEMEVPNKRERSLEMVATGNTVVESSAYTARASRLSYAEAKDLLILESDGRTDAELYCQERVGAEMQRFAARRIYYWPSTNHWTIDSGSILEVNRPGKPEPPAPPHARPAPR